MYGFFKKVMVGNIKHFILNLITPEHICTWILLYTVYIVNYKHQDLFTYLFHFIGVLHRTQEYFIQNSDNNMVGSN